LSSGHLANEKLSIVKKNQSSFRFRCFKIFKKIWEGKSERIMMKAEEISQIAAH
jgi:hypothetical protein